MKNKTVRKYIASVVTLLAAAFAKPVTFANATPPFDPKVATGHAAAPTAPPAQGAAPVFPGSGATGGDAGTGRTVDFKKMLMQLLGLDDTADEAAVSNAFNACMATEPDKDDEVIKGKLDEAMTAKDKADSDKAEAEKKFGESKAANEKLTAQLAEKETLMANAKTELETRATKAEEAFANERNAHSKTIVVNAITSGRLTKAEGEAKEKELANAKTPEEFATLVKAIANARTQLQTTGTVGVLERTIAPGTASHEFQTAVQNLCNEDSSTRHDKWAFHWGAFSKTEKGKALLAQMKQPQSSKK